VWAFDTDVGAPRLTELEALLTHDEQERAWRFRLAVDRTRFVAGRGQLRIILGRYAGTTPQSLRFTRSAYGKPSISTETGGEHFRFNASRSAGIALAAIRRDSDIGVDIERIRPLPDATALAATVLTARERADLAALPEVTFLEYWTRKEAIVKSLGRGVSLSFDRIELHPWAGNAGCRVEIAQDGINATQWVAALKPPRDGYVAAVATTCDPNGAVPQIRRFALPLA
jgi:4'-phosphopantetheinyl transferase